MRYRHISLMLALVVAATSMLGACSSESDSSTVQASSTVQESSITESADVSSVTTDTSEEPEPVETDDDKYRMKDKITYLSCIEEANDIPELASLGDGKLLVLNWRYQQEQTSVRVVDILEDKVIAETVVDGYAAFKSVASGGFILENVDMGEFCFFDEDLELYKTFKPESLSGTFSPDGLKYYQIICGKLYSEDVNSGEFTHIQTSPDLEFSDRVFTNTSDGRYIGLLYDKYTGLYAETAEIRLDLSSNSIDMLTFDIEFPKYSNDHMYARIFSEEEETEKFYRIALDGSDCIVFDMENYDIDSVSGSDYLVCFEMSETPYPEILLVGADDSGKFGSSVLNADDSEEYFSWFTYMPQEELIACCSEKNGAMRICLIDPSLFDLSGEVGYDQTECPDLYDEEIYDDYLVSSKIPECPEELKDLRERADKLEEQYGIKIYMSSECKDMVTSIGYDCTDEFFDSWDEYMFIETALDGMEAALAKYPEGFLWQFRSATGDGGIRICLTAYIHDDFSVAYAIQTGGWYNIVMDVRYNCEVNTAHELWHSTESYISDRDYLLLSEEKWMTFAPEGFEYSDEFKEDSGGMSEYCYYYGDDWYFYDNYSKVNSLEDKARIMEIVMNPDVFPSDDFVSSEHILKKLECMNDAVRQTFDTSSWGDDVLWERFSS